jgi:RNA polymerase sigma-70 factor, ECF subfamily
MYLMGALALPGWLSLPRPIIVRLPRILSWMTSMHHSASDDGIPVEHDEATLQAFYEIFARYQKPIADFLFRMTRDADWAADLTQDTFVKAYTHLNELPNITNVRAWLYRIAANTAHNALRHRRRFAWVPLTDITPNDSSDPHPGVVLAASGDMAANVVERDVLLTALGTLPTNARAVLLLRATAGFDTAEIASMLGLTEANTRKILYRAKEKLRQILTQGSQDEGDFGE